MESLWECRMPRCRMDDWLMDGPSQGGARLRFSSSGIICGLLLKQFQTKNQKNWFKQHILANNIRELVIEEYNLTGLQEYNHVLWYIRLYNPRLIRILIPMHRYDYSRAAVVIWKRNIMLALIFFWVSCVSALSMSEGEALFVNTCKNRMHMPQYFATETVLGCQKLLQSSRTVVCLILHQNHYLYKWICYHHHSINNQNVIAAKYTRWRLYGWWDTLLFRPFVLTIVPLNIPLWSI